MDKNDLRHHISQQYNEELQELRNRVLAMGGFVEKQITDAVEALAGGDVELADHVITADYQVNAQEVAIDEECTQILALRQPAHQPTGERKEKRHDQRHAGRRRLGLRAQA